MRYLTVPYTISYFGYQTDYKLDLYKIWKNQSLSEPLKDLLYKLMKEVEKFIKTKAPGALYGEWAKKEECWNELRKQKFDIDFKTIKSDLEDSKNPSQRKRLADEETATVRIKEELEIITSVPPEIWHKIEDWGRRTDNLTEQQKTVAYNLAGRVRHNTKISDYERTSGINILDIVIKKAPELLEGIDEINEKNKHKPESKKITLDLVQKIVKWDKKNKALQAFEYTFMAQLATGEKPLSDHNMKLALFNLNKVIRKGFTESQD
jgi:hypothetical protein